MKSLSYDNEAAVIWIIMQWDAAHTLIGICSVGEILILRVKEA